MILGVVMLMVHLEFRKGPSSPGENEEATSGEEADKPVNLAKEYVELLEQTKEGLSNLKDTEPVQKVIQEAKELGPVIGDVLRRAFSGPTAPDEEETEDPAGDE